MHLGDPHSRVVSQSIGPEYSKQGVEIKSYQDVYNTMSPRLLSNSTPTSLIDGKPVQTGRIFDESLLEKINLSKRETIPNHEIEKRDFGYPKLFKNDTPFEDYSSALPVEYIKMQGDPASGYQLLDLAYPYVLDTPGQVSPGVYDGIIEPFTIRSWSTLEASDRPFSARRVRGGLSAYSEDQFGICTPIEQKIFFSYGKSMSRPYVEYGDERNELIDQKFGYFANEPENPNPFLEKTKEEIFSSIIEEEFTEALSLSDSAFDEIGKDYISSAAGYTFINTENGTDSIAFFDQKGI